MNQSVVYYISSAFFFSFSIAVKATVKCAKVDIFDKVLHLNKLV